MTLDGQEEEDENPSAQDVTAEAPGFEALLDALRRERGFDFTGYKRSTLMRRIERRMQTVGATTFDEYRAYLAAQGDEFPQLFNTILINVTAFFRDAPAWEFIAQEVLPGLLEGRAPDRPFRVWSAGCATGEEAFSAAMLLAEALGMDRHNRTGKIYATDVDQHGLS